MREGTPDRVYHIELFLDQEVQDTLCDRFGLLDGLDPEDRFFRHRRQVALQSFLGYDYVRWSLEGQEWPLHYFKAQDTATLSRRDGRSFVDMHRGPITSWEEFEAYPWPDPKQASTEGLEWFEEHLPEGMCVMGQRGFCAFCGTPDVADGV